ncbi:MULTISPECIES: hypothetical protein [Proteiniphilum]|jgi:hypothetical protein|uniref:hypothetical protein n=2 Tax=Dysgonomonadaceae TaxID=2005520 RepID=UPI001EEA014D|nr:MULTISPECIES: hypothetical protein [Proteiniphilum]ULB33213.1 hypothetical protein KDN43_09160 [Proteiniphilum propionicum]
MMNKMKYILLHCSTLLILLFSCSEKNDLPIETEDPDEKPEVLENAENIKKVAGNSIQIDPIVFYSLNISPGELVADLKKANITSVHFFLVTDWDGSKNDELLRPEYLKALKDNGIEIWALFIGNGMYGGQKLPEEWKMEFLTQYTDPSVRFFSFHNDDYVTWQVERIRRILTNYDFIGISFAETYFPEWRTINSNGFYGDVSLYARRKFTREYLGLNRSALTFDAIRNDPTLYKKWQDYRVEAIINFNKKIKEAVRKVNSKAIFASWGIALRNETLGEIREHFGLDMVRLVKEVKPDIFFIQTSSQDWLDPNLKSDYLNQYEYARKTIQAANPNVRMAVQTDIASLSYHNPGIGVRLPNWWIEFMNHSARLGYYTNTSYEYAFCKKQNLWIK